MIKCPLVHKVLLVGIIALLASCASSEPAPPAIHPLEQNALNSLSLGRMNEARDALYAALKEYQSLDDLAGQWRIRYRLATMAFDAGDKNEALKQVNVLQKLVQVIPSNNADSQQAKYHTNLLLGRTLQDSQYYDRAMSYATTAIEQAVVKTYQGYTEEAVEMISNSVIDHPADQAFIFYQHATATASEKYFSYALQAYQNAQDPRGVADCLFSMAKINAADQQIDRAQDFAARAILTLEAAGDKKRAELVTQWLNNL